MLLSVFQGLTSQGLEGARDELCTPGWPGSRRSLLSSSLCPDADKGSVNAQPSAPFSFLPFQLQACPGLRHSLLPVPRLLRKLLVRAAAWKRSGEEGRGWTARGGRPARGVWCSAGERKEDVL